MLFLPGRPTVRCLLAVLPLLPALAGAATASAATPDRLLVTVASTPADGGGNWKTEAAFFPLLSQMDTEDWKPVSVVYVAPLRALINNLDERTSGYGAYQYFGYRSEHGAYGYAYGASEPTEAGGKAKDPKVANL